MLRNIDVAFAAALRVLSWILGLLDTVYVHLSIRRRTGRFFEDGYGDLAEELRLQTHIRETAAPQMLSKPNQLPNPAEKVIKELSDQQAKLKATSSSADVECVKAHFTSPMADFLPEESKQCRIFVIKPPKGVRVEAVCVMLPSTADEGEVIRRKLYADIIASKGVVGVIIEAPYYGSRRPAAQKQWFLRQLHHSFTQVFTIGYEAACLLHWAQHTWHLPLAITGVSAGAAMAGLAAKFFNGPVAVVAYMGCAGPAEPFTQGVMQSAVCWEAMQEPPCDPRLFGNPADTAHLPRDRAAFLSYCRFFTDSSILRDSLPAHGTGQQVLCVMQARDDGFVSFTDGKTMFNELLYLAEGIKDIHLHRSDSDDSFDGGGIQAVYGAMKRALNSYTDLLNSTGSPSKKSSKKDLRTLDVAASDRVLRSKKQAKAMASTVKSSEFVEIAGGHCTGFLRCNSLLPDAILTSLDRLRKKTAAACN